MEKGKDWKGRKGSSEERKSQVAALNLLGDRRTPPPALGLPPSCYLSLVQEDSGS